MKIKLATIIAIFAIAVIGSFTALSVVLHANAGWNSWNATSYQLNSRIAAYRIEVPNKIILEDVEKQHEYIPYVFNAMSSAFNTVYSTMGRSIDLRSSLHHSFGEFVEFRDLNADENMLLSKVLSLTNEIVDDLGLDPINQRMSIQVIDRSDVSYTLLLQVENIYIF